MGRHLRRGRAGIEELIPQIVDLEPALVLLEATGGLELPLVAALAAAALPVVVVPYSSSPGAGVPPALGKAQQGELTMLVSERRFRGCPPSRASNWPTGTGRWCIGLSGNDGASA